MDTLRIAVASNDGVTLAHSHMGDAERFVIYDLVDGARPRVVETRRNPVREMGHAGTGKMRAVAEVLSGVDIFVSGRMSPNFRKLAAQTPFQPVVVQAERIEDAIDLLAGAFDELARLVVSRRKGERPETIPRLSGDSREKDAGEDREPA